MAFTGGKAGSGMIVDTGDIVQITYEPHHWFPCLVVVQEKKPWGVMGYALIPHNDEEPTGHAYTRLTFDEIEVVGHAAIIEKEAAE